MKMKMILLNMANDHNIPDITLNTLRYNPLVPGEIFFYREPISLFYKDMYQ